MRINFSKEVAARLPVAKVVFCGILFLFGTLLFLPAPFGIYVFLMALLLRIFPENRHILFALGGFGLTVFSSHFWGGHLALGGNPVTEDYILRSLILAATFGFLLLLKAKGIGRRHTLATVSALFLITLTIVSHSASSEALLGLLVIQKVLFWTMCIYLRSNRSEKFIFPAWAYYHPFLPSTTPACTTTTQGRENLERHELFISGVKAIWVGNFLVCLGTIGFRIGFGWKITQDPTLIQLLNSVPSLDLHYFHSDTSVFLAESTIFERWSAMILYSLSVYSLMAGAFSTNVGIARAFGIQIPNMMNRPWLAKNFSEFYLRIFFFYNSLLVAFVYPAVSSAMPLRLRPRIRVASTIFLTVLFGGLFFHFLFFFNIWERTGLVAHVFRMAHVSPYFLCLATLSSVSVLNEGRPIFDFLPFTAFTRPVLMTLISILNHSCFAAVGTFSRSFEYWLLFIASLVGLS